MFNGSVPIILDSLKQHYFIDRDGRMFRHILNYLRNARLVVPDDLREIDLLYEEARYFELTPMMIAIDDLKRTTERRLRWSSSSSSPGTVDGGGGGGGRVDCAALNVNPELGERIALSAGRSVLEELFPELTVAVWEDAEAAAAARGSSAAAAEGGPAAPCSPDETFVIRFPLNGYCKLNSVQVVTRFLSSGFQIVASTGGGGVDGQQFSEYLFCRRRKIQ